MSLTEMGRLRKIKLVTENKCKYCGEKMVKFGTVPTVKGGTKQRLRCQKCGKTAYEEDNNEEA